MLNQNFILVLDVETANDIADPLVYDIGGMMIDQAGNIYDQFSFAIRDIFCGQRELVKSAYYGHKLPEYLRELQAGSRKLVDFWEARSYILKLLKTFDCKIVAAYNCSFDRGALNTTLRYLTKSKQRWFFPRNIQFICIWNMACNSICQTSEYKTFAETNRHWSNKGRNYRSSAEVVYAFLTNNPDFEEAHRGLDDVRIEKDILVKCLQIGTTVTEINRGCWQKVKRGALVLCA